MFTLIYEGCPRNKVSKVITTRVFGQIYWYSHHKLPHYSSTSRCNHHADRRISSTVIRRQKYPPSPCKNFRSQLFSQDWISAFSSLSSPSFFPVKCCFRCRNRWSLMGPGQDYKGGRTSHLYLLSQSLVMFAEWGGALSCWTMLPLLSCPCLLCCTASLSLSSVMHYLESFMVCPGCKN